jgi:hypothetical protein
MNEFALIYKALPDDLGRRLAELAEVPPAYIDMFQVCCGGCIANAVWSLRRQKARAAAFKELEGVLKDARGLHTRLVRLNAALRQFESYGLFESGEQLDLDAPGMAAQWLGASRARRVCVNAARLGPDEWPSDPFPHDAMAAIAAALMPPLCYLAADAKTAKRSLRGGRKDEHRLARELIVVLERLAVSMGGSFGLDHHGPTGSLVDALTLLKDHFPKGFFPKIASTMQTDLREARRQSTRSAAFSV